MLLNLCKRIILLVSFFIMCFSVVQADQDYKLNKKTTLTTDVNQSSSLMTRPNIVVSIEPLYEMVSTLSHGVVKPEVIYFNFSDIKQPLSS